MDFELQMKDNFEPRFGFVNFAEIWNGRLAMVGILIGLTTEVLTGQGILTQMGIGWETNFLLIIFCLIWKVLENLYLYIVSMN